MPRVIAEYVMVGRNANPNRITSISTMASSTVAVDGNAASASTRTVVVSLLYTEPKAFSIPT
jgi:hypothetical protein